MEQTDLKSKESLTRHEKKVKHFLYTSSLLILCTSSVNLIWGNRMDSCNLIAIGTGLYGIGKSITLEDSSIQKLKFYQTTSLIGCIGSGNAMRLTTDPVSFLINSFLLGNFFLFSYTFYNEKKGLNKALSLQKTNQS